MSRETETRWFLCTDIVGSTPLWEQWPDGMRVALDRHDAVLERVIEECSGAVFKHTGDGVLAAFDDPLAAVGAAIDAQREMSDLEVAAGVPLDVRMGIDGGDVVERDGDYFGPALNRATRIMDTGHGGQVVLSDDVADHLADAATSTRSLGTFRLKGVRRPVRLLQLLHADLGTHFPPLRALNAETGNLTRPERGLIGRDTLVAELGLALAEPGTTTLSGPGGVGKTSLAVTAAWNSLHHAPDGAWFVDLLQAEHPDQVAEVVASTLGLDRRAGSGMIETLSDALADRQLILLLDNCEHVVTGASAVARALVLAAPSLRVLATSRRYLEVPHERRIAVGPLEVPRGRVSPTALARVASVTLFIDRARERGAELTITADNAADLAELCDRLDGVPLALELAAARCNLLSVGQIARGLDQRFRLLADDVADDARHRTMKATIAWSYDLLDSTDQAAFASLQVFDGGFDVAAFAAVLDVDQFDAIDTIGRLVALNLVVVESGGHDHRYRLMESVREYTTEVMGDAGVDQPGVITRHADHYRAAFTDAVVRLKSDDERSVLDWLRIERGNLRRLFDHDLIHQPDLAAQMPLSLWSLWMSRNLIEEGLRWLERAKEVLPPDHPLLARILDDLASVAWTRGEDLYAEEACLASIAAAERRDDPAPVTTLVRLASIRAGQSRTDEARDLLEAAIEHVEAGLPVPDVVSIRSVIGATLAMAGDLERAVPYCEQGIEDMRNRGPSMRASALFNAAICFLFVDVERGYETAKEAFLESAKIEASASSSSAHFALGLAQRIRGERIASIEHCAYALDNYRLTGALQQAPLTIETIASQLRTDPIAAVRLTAASVSLRERIGRPGLAFEQAQRERLLVRLREQVGDAFDDAWAEGFALAFDAAVDEAIAVALDEIATERGLDDGPMFELASADER